MDRRDFLRTSVLGLALAGTGTLGSCVRSRSQFDTIIRDGMIYDGSGRAAVRGDLGIRDGRIAAIGQRLGDSADTIIDAKGMAVSPGFIDIHSHTDTNLLLAPKGDSRIWQGITSEVGGNCGDSPFIYSDEVWAEKKGTERCGFPAWRDVDGFYDTLRQSGIGINYCSLAGHGNIREAVVGPYNVPASDGDIRRMCAILDEQLSKGAAGLSFGLEYAPGCYSDTREMVELCKVVREHDAFFAIHMRNEDDHVLEALDEAIEVARLSGARLEVSHLKAQNPANFDKLPLLLEKINNARSEGLDIAFDRYPYTAFSTGFTSFIPVALRDGTDEDILRRLEDPAACAKIREYTYSRLDRFGGPEKVLVAGCENPANAAYAGKDLAECCRISGMDEWEMVRYLLISEKLGVQQATFAMKEENLRMIYAHPLSMPGSDGSVYSPAGPLGSEIPHPRSYGSFPRFFEQFVRKDKVLDLATAIHKCTALPASRIHLKDRGLLVPGYAADVTVFDPETIADAATYARPHTFAEGIHHVFVNGKHTICEGSHTGELAGEILSRA